MENSADSEQVELWIYANEASFNAKEGPTQDK